MTKVVHCRDIGFDCEGVIRAETEEEVMQLVAEHAGSVHDMKEIPEEVVQKVQAVMRDEYWYLTLRRLSGWMSWRAPSSYCGIAAPSYLLPRRDPCGRAL